MKKIICLIAVIAMIFVMGTVAFAAETNVDVANEADLTAAISSAVAGDVVNIKLTDSFATSSTATIKDGVTVNLDMNGKTITVTDNKASNVSYEFFYNYGVLNVAGNGTIEMISTSNDTAWAKSSTIFHNRGGVLTIENGTFTHLGGTAMAFVVDNSANSYGDATTYIEGGTLSSAYIAIRNRMERSNLNGTPGNGTAILNVSGGEIGGTSRAIWAQAASADVNNLATGEITISGGTIGLIDTARSAGAESMTTISGGTVAAFKGEAGELTVSGGAITGAITILDASGQAINTLPDASDAEENTVITTADGKTYIKKGDDWVELTHFGEHEDADKDHKCDYECGRICGVHEDKDSDHLCDYGCKVALSECADAENDGDHLCDLCKKENISEHSWKDATCTEAKTCEECGETEGKELGHAWDDGKITKYPTYTEKGVMTYTCTKGGTEHFKTEEIPALVAADEENGTFDVIEGDDGTEYIVDYQEGIVFVPEDLPEEVKDEYKTSEDIISAFEVKVSEGNLDQEKVETTVYEVTVGYFENDVFVPATEEFFEENKTLKITLPYPEGADRNDKFEIYHLNAKTGEIDKYSTETYGFYRITRTAKGLVIEVNSLSPFAIAFESVETAPSSGKLPGIVGGKPVTIIDGLPKEENESNPNTGAPAVSVVPVLVAAAAVFFKKR